MANTFIIVLGNHEENIKNKRVASAVAYYKQLDVIEHYSDILKKNIPTTFFIMSGGPKHKPEAGIMKSYAISLGIPEEIIFVEGKSRNTIENLVFSLKMIKDIFFNHKIKLIICSSRFHMKRTFVLGNKILKNMNVEYISTNEEISVCERNREICILNTYLDQILSTEIKAF